MFGFCKPTWYNGNVYIFYMRLSIVNVQYLVRYRATRSAYVPFHDKEERQSSSLQEDFAQCGTTCLN